MTLNPYAPPSQTDDTSLSVRPRSRSSWLSRVILLHALVALVGTSLATYKIESILFSGPVLLLFGVILALLGRRRRDLPTVLLGLSSPVLAVVVVGMINLVPYSPTTGYWPLLYLFVGYLALALPVSGWLLFSRVQLGFQEYTG